MITATQPRAMDSSSTLRVLLVEDNPGDARLIELLLLEAGRHESIALTHVDRLAAAREAITRGTVDVVLLDLGLPDSQGLSTLTRMRAVAGDAAIVVLTGQSAADNVDFTALRGGAEDFLYKDRLSADRLLRALHYAAVRQQRARRLAAAAEMAERHARFSAELAGALTPQQVAAVALRHGAEVSQASAALLLAQAEPSDALRPLRSSGVSAAQLAAWARLGELEPTPVADALAASAPLELDAGDLELRYPTFAEAVGAPHPAHWLFRPLIAAARALGALVLRTDGSAPLPAGARRALERQAERAAVALDRALLYERERRATAAAEAALRERDEVLGIVAHDLRNPLSAIAILAAVLSDDALPPEKRHAFLGEIERGVEQMDDLIRDLLTAAHLHTGHLEVEPDEVEPDQLLVDAAERAQPLARDRGVQLRCEPATALPAVLADRARIRQALGNLIGNALTFTPAGGTITLRAALLGAEALLSVSDTGPGIEREHLPHVFERYWQARPSRRGAGLGLAIVKGIVERHGGRVGVDSAPGEGATFFFTLPVAGAACVGAASPASRTADSTAAPPRPARVLIVDDHPLVLRGLRRFLGRDGRFDVVAESLTAMHAIELARLARPDLAIIDLDLPDLSGIDAIRQIAAAAPAVRMLALTGAGEDDALLATLSAGAHGFIRKSRTHDLLDALDAIVAGELYVPSGMDHLLRTLATRREAQALLAQLSEPERQVLTLAAEGYVSSEIAQRVFLSPRTVETYRSRAMRKLGVASRNELVDFALRSGLLHP
jgi:signal transduction histidine kinase/DNA-binding NarL/FixJ family response regulator